MTEAALRYGLISDIDDLIDKLVRLQPHKPFNGFLILLQRPHATHVLAAHVWEERYGHVPRPGEQPLVLLLPHGPVMFLFDVSQVEPGPNAPTGVELEPDPFSLEAWPQADVALRSVIANAMQDGVRVGTQGVGVPLAGYIRKSHGGAYQRVNTPSKPTSGKFVDVPVRYDVILSDRHSPTEHLATMAHELGHLYCGHLGEMPSAVVPGEVFWPDRSRMKAAAQEAEARAVEDLVCRTIGLTGPWASRLHLTIEVSPSLVGIDLEPVLTAAGRILEMAKGPAPRRSRRKAPRS